MSSSNLTLGQNSIAIVLGTKCNLIWFWSECNVGKEQSRNQYFQLISHPLSFTQQYMRHVHTNHSFGYSLQSGVVRGEVRSEYQTIQLQSIQLHECAQSFDDIFRMFDFIWMDLTEYHAIDCFTSKYPCILHMSCGFIRIYADEYCTTDAQTQCHRFLWSHTLL